MKMVVSELSAFALVGLVLFSIFSFWLGFTVVLGPA